MMPIPRVAICQLKASHGISTCRLRYIATLSISTLGSPCLDLQGNSDRAVPRLVIRKNSVPLVGQIVFLAKHVHGPEWKTLSIPRGKSEEYKAGTPGYKHGLSLADEGKTGF